MNMITHDNLFASCCLSYYQTVSGQNFAAIVPFLSSSALVWPCMGEEVKKAY